MESQRAGTLKHTIETHLDMAWIPGGTFRMGSEEFYPEERPVHDVTVDGFWMDCHEVTNEQFSAFVEATGYKTLAERPLNPADFPGAPAENLVPGSMVFQKTSGPVDLRTYFNWWAWIPGGENDVPIFADAHRNHRLNVQHCLGAFAGSDVEVAIVLDRHADQAGDRILRRFLQLFRSRVCRFVWCRGIRCS